MTNKRRFAEVLYLMYVVYPGHENHLTVQDGFESLTLISQKCFYKKLIFEGHRRLNIRKL